MSDVLTDLELYQEGPRWIEPFNRDRVRSASYDVSAGDILSIAYSPKQGGRRSLSLRVAKAEALPPGLIAILWSYEKFDLPDDVQARISLRSDFATRGLFFAGGIIDPGFGKRELWFPIANLSSREIRIEYMQPMFRVEFTRLSRIVTNPYKIERMDIREEDMPSLPDEPVFDIAEVSRRLAAVESKAQLFEPSSTIVTGFLLASIAGIVAGASFAAIDTIDDNRAAIAAGIAIGAVLGVFFLILLARLFRR